MASGFAGALGAWVSGRDRGRTGEWVEMDSAPSVVADVWLIASKVRCEIHDAEPSFFCQEEPLGMCRGRVRKAVEAGFRFGVE